MEEFKEFVIKAKPYVVVYSLLTASNVVNVFNWLSYILSTVLSFAFFSCKNQIPQPLEQFDFDEWFDIDEFLDANFETFADYLRYFAEETEEEEVTPTANLDS